MSISYGECGDSYKTGNNWNDTTLGNAKLWDGLTTGLKLTVGKNENDLSLKIYLHDPLSAKIKVKQKKKNIEGQLQNVTVNLPADLKIELRKKSGLALVKTSGLLLNNKFKFSKVKAGRYVVVIRNLEKSIIVKKL